MTLARVPFLYDVSYRMNVTFEGFEDAFDQIADVFFTVRATSAWHERRVRSR